MLIHPDLASALPALSDDELTQLEANLLSDGFVIDPILFFTLDSEQVVLDGMHRLPIAEKHNLPFEVREHHNVKTLKEAKNWIRNHQLGRRNLLKPASIRKLVGDWYNEEKRADKGQGLANLQPSVSISPIPAIQIEQPGKTLRKPALQLVAEQAGVSISTVQRDAKYAAALAKLPTYLAKAIETGTAKTNDDAVLKLAELDRNIQEEVGRDVRVGIHRTIQDAMKARNLLKDETSKPAKKAKTVDQTKKNTNRELFRETPDDFYSNSIFVTEHGEIGISVGGSVIVRTLKQWHQAAQNVMVTMDPKA